MNIFKLIFNLLLPAHCSICGRELFYYEQHFCLHCYADIPLTYFWTLKRHPAEQTFWGRCYIEKVYCLFIYTNNYRKPIHELKYKGNVKIGLYLGEMLGKKICLLSFPITYLVPVPLHWRKRIARGYNQSEIIAQGILKGMQGKCAESRREEKTGTLPFSPTCWLEKLLQKLKQKKRG
ncbi:MAG: ComF family protein [Bacteroidales bacterium]|nr:ComF family protein [Bacteroidales bacterium]